MATSLNLGNIKGDQGFPGRETITVYRPTTIGDAVPAIPTGGDVAADGTITAPTDWFNPADLVFDVTTQDLYSSVITWDPSVNPAPYTFLTWDVVIRDNGRTGADSIAPTIQIDEQPVGTPGSDPVFAEAAGSTEQARVYDITLSTGATGEQGIPGPAGSASIFLTDTVTSTIPMRWTTRGTDDGVVPIGYKAYIAANTTVNGLCRFYSGAAVTANAWITGGAPMVTLAAPGGSIVLCSFDNNGVALTWTVGETYTFEDGANTWAVTLTTAVTAPADLPDAAIFTDLGMLAFRATTVLVGTGSESMTGSLWTIDNTFNIAVAGQTFSQGAFTLDVLPANADLYLKRTAGTVTTAADEASLPENSADFQIINLP